MRVRWLAAALALTAFAVSTGGCGQDDATNGEVPIPRAGDPGIRFGYNEDIQPGGADIAMLPASGADVVRRRLSWNEIEPEAGAADWTKYDAVYDELIAAQARPLWVLTDAPCFAAAPTAGCDPLDIARAVGTEHAGELGGFMAAAAARYPESFGFEVGNEVNDGRFWEGGLRPADYAVLLGASADAVHAVDPAMPVVSSGPFPVTERRPGKVPWRDFLAGIVESGVTARIDAIAFHPYAPLEPGEDPGPAVGALLDEASAYLAGLGAGSVPIWVTEVGLSTVGDPPLGEAEQAAGLTSIYRELEARGTPVVIVHRFKDAYDPAFPLELGFGVLRADGTTPKPAYCARRSRRAVPVNAVTCAAGPFVAPFASPCRSSSEPRTSRGGPRCRSSSASADRARRCCG